MLTLLRHGQLVSDRMGKRCKCWIVTRYAIYLTLCCVPNLVRDWYLSRCGGRVLLYEHAGSDVDVAEAMNVDLDADDDDDTGHRAATEVSSSSDAIEAEEEVD